MEIESTLKSNDVIITIHICTPDPSMDGAQTKC